ncbi:hypothetical protein CYMTET_38544 [Cymbomonas tetramitiformis]|uniref:Uncharacterized protein n=1 Tax=Cymbomonas tetramitiformis TaxID=36881 RepID=A0AAE0CBU9_9CHLO|nr:hypothetical protein CYMTET_38544 [Cymbomonas tetramitiformis]
MDPVDEDKLAQLETQNCFEASAQHCVLGVFGTAQQRRDDPAVCATKGEISSSSGRSSGGRGSPWLDSFCAKSTVKLEMLKQRRRPAEKDERCFSFRLPCGQPGLWRCGSSAPPSAGDAVPARSGAIRLGFVSARCEASVCAQPHIRERERERESWNSDRTTSSRAVPCPRMEEWYSLGGEQGGDLLVSAGM